MYETPLTDVQHLYAVSTSTVSFFVVGKTSLM